MKKLRQGPYGGKRRGLRSEISTNVVEGTPGRLHRSCKQVPIMSSGRPARLTPARKTTVVAREKTKQILELDEKDKKAMKSSEKLAAKTPVKPKVEKSPSRATRSQVREENKETKNQELKIRFRKSQVFRKNKVEDVSSDDMMPQVTPSRSPSRSTRNASVSNDVKSQSKSVNKKVDRQNHKLEINDSPEPTPRQTRSQHRPATTTNVTSALKKKAEAVKVASVKNLKRKSEEMDETPSRATRGRPPKTPTTRTPIPKKVIRKSLVERGRQLQQAVEESDSDSSSGEESESDQSFAHASSEEDDHHLDHYEDENDENEQVKATSKQPKTPKATKTPTVPKKKVLGKKEKVEPLKGREKEFSQIEGWINDAIDSNKSSAFYISGPPGTGKTATTSLVLKSFAHRCQTAIINCMAVRTFADLKKAILVGCESDTTYKVTQIANFFKELTDPLIVVLDEIDHLSTPTNTILYSAFKWPTEFKHKLILIGIANSIDLTERELPKLKLFEQPKLMVFSPYTTENITEILEDKMKTSTVKLDNKAVELCARKVAAMTGDLRSALHVFKLTQGKVESANGTSGGIREVLGVLNNVYSSPISKAKLPVQSELLLAVCLTMSTNNKTPLTREKLFNCYGKACELTNTPKLDNDDLPPVFQILQDQSFITVAKNGQIRLQVEAKIAQQAISNCTMIEQVKALRVL